jgi:hypothetical protein
MGQLLSSFTTTENIEKVFIDFEKATPSDEERALYDTVAEVLSKAPGILDQLCKYAGCQEFIRKAISTPSIETESAAWEALLPAVDQLQQFYEFSVELEQCFPKLLVALCKDERGTEKGTRSLSNKEALASQLAHVFDFVLRFDDAKIVMPDLQNDFSYYRRTLHRMKAKQDANIKVGVELANRMSLFFAYPTPMMKVLSETTAKFLLTDVTVPKEKVSSMLAALANVCRDMVEHKKFSNEQFIMLSLRAMVGSVILYCNLCEQAAFTKKSPINIEGCVHVLKNLAPTTDGLLNTIRFTTRFNDR